MSYQTIHLLKRILVSMMGSASVKDLRIAEVVATMPHISVSISGDSYIFDVLWTVKIYRHLGADVLQVSKMFNV